MNGDRPVYRAVRGYAPQKRPVRCATAPVRPHTQPPRGSRPRARGISRDHTNLTRGQGVTCRHTQGLDDVWSARHVGSVVGDIAYDAAPSCRIEEHHDRP